MEWWTTSDMKRGHIDLDLGFLSTLVNLAELRLFIPIPPRRLGYDLPALRSLHLQSKHADHAASFAPTLTYTIAHAPRLDTIVCHQNDLQGLSANTSPRLDSGVGTNTSVRSLRVIGDVFDGTTICEEVAQLCARLPGVKRLSQELLATTGLNLVRPFLRASIVAPR